MTGIYECLIFYTAGTISIEHVTIFLSKYTSKDAIDTSFHHKLSNALNRHGLYARSPGKTPLLKKKHVEACLKFAAQHLDKPVKYWENIVWSEESKIELWMP